MADRHRDPNVTVRPTEEEKATAADLLRAKGWTAQGFLLACLRGLLHEPDRWIAMAEPHWRPDKPKGRPRKSATPEVDSTSGPAFDQTAGDAAELITEPFEDPT